MKTAKEVVLATLCPHIHQINVLLDNFAGAKREMHQVPQMGPREHRQRVSTVWAVGYQRQLHGFRGGSR